MNKNIKTSLFFYLALIALIAAGVWLADAFSNNNSSDYSYVQFIDDLKNNNVESVVVQQNTEIPTGVVQVKLKDDNGKTRSFYTADVSTIEDKFEEIVNADDSKIDSSFTLKDVKRTSVFLKVIFYVLLFAGGIVLIMILTSQAGGGGSKAMSFGKSRAKMSVDVGKTVTFKNVAGLHEEKEDLEEIVDFLKEPTKYIEAGARIPKGVMLVGPPGTGKTLLARAVAGEAGVPFFSISGSDFVEMFVGVGASRVRDLFSEAKKNSPCIVFIDEIDAVARRRGSGLGGGHDEREQTLNQMLVEMDGFNVNEGIIVMAATNRVDILDPAILRPGRFDRKIHVGIPDVRAREEILNVHIKNKSLGDDVDLKQLARTTAGFTGADLENLMNESAIYAARDNRKFIKDEDVKKSIIKVGIGTERKSKKVSERDRKITAYHEAGHAILHNVLPDIDNVYAVSIIPTGESAAGYTMHVPESDDQFSTKGQMLQDIQSYLGGRIAEELIFDDITAGASQDIKMATSKARAMVTLYGMSDRVGLINYGDDDEDEVFLGRDLGHSRKYGENVATSIDEEVKSIIDSCYKKAKQIIVDNMDQLHKCANLLLERERISGEELKMLLNGQENNM